MLAQLTPNWSWAPPALILGWQELEEHWGNSPEQRPWGPHRAWREGTSPRKGVSQEMWGLQQVQLENPRNSLTASLCPVSSHEVFARIKAGLGIWDTRSCQDAPGRTRGAQDLQEPVDNTPGEAGIGIWAGEGGV